MTDQNRIKQIEKEITDLSKELAHLRKETGFLSGSDIKSMENRYFEEIIKHSSDLHYIHDQNNILQYVSPNCLEFFGYSQKEMKINWHKLVTENEINKKGIELTEKALKTGRKQKPYILELRKKEGEKIWVRIEESPLKDSNNKVIGIVGFLRDITTEKESQELLKENEVKFRELFENMNSGVVIYDVREDGKEFYLNDINSAGIEILRIEKEKFLGREIRQFLPEMDNYGLPQVFRRVWDTGLPEKMPIKVYQDSRIIQWLENIVYKIPQGQIINIFQDTSKEHKIQNELKESRLKYKQLIDNLSGLICEIDEEGNFLFVNDEYKPILGYETQELLGRNAAEMMHPEDRKISASRLTELVESRKRSVDVWRFKHKEGAYLFFECHASVYDDLEGKKRIVVISYDVTRKIQDVSRLKIERERLERAEKVAEFGHWEFDMNTGIVEASQNAHEIYGLVPGNFTIPEVQKIPLEQYRPSLDKALEDLIKNGRPYNEIFRIKKPTDGEYRDIHSIAHYSKENNRVFGVIHDITEALERERALRESEERFRLIIEENPVPMVLTDNNQDILSFNKKFTQLFGYSLEDIRTAEEWWNAAYPDENYRHQVQNSWNSEAENAMEEKGESQKQVWRISCKNGDIKEVEFQFVSLGEVNVISMVDLTELKSYERELLDNKNKLTAQYEELATLNEELMANLEESSRINKKLENARQNLSKSEEETKSLLEQTKLRNTEISMLLAGAREVLVSRNFESTSKILYRYVSKLTASTSGFISLLNKKNQKQEVLFLFENKKFRKVKHSFELPVHKVFGNTEKPGEAAIYNDLKGFDFMKGLPEDHPEITNAIFVPLILNNSLMGTFCLANKKENYTGEEKYIVSAFGELAAIALRNSLNLDELQMQKERAEESDRLKSSFLSNMSHEIRTPMNSIVGFSEFLSRESISEEKRKKFSKLIAGSSEQLLRLINDIIDISKIESNQLKVEKSWFHLINELQEIYIRHKESLQLSGKKVKLSMQIRKESLPEYLYTDKLRFRQIIDNLMVNAIKFTREGSINLDVSRVSLGKIQQVKIAITDTGIGIPETMKKFVFDRFTQAHDESVSKGAGLGLSITRGLVELLGGKSGFRSREGQGSSFYFTIPLSDPDNYTEEAGDKEEEICTPDFTGRKIFIAEDDPASVILLEEILTETGIEMDFFSNGRAMLNALEDERPDIVLVDINMPVLDGISAVRELREKYRDLPVIAQTAYAMVEERNRCIAAGCNDYITKPISQEALLAKLSGFLLKA